MDTLKRAYFSTYQGNLNGKLELFNLNSSGKIYYTIDVTDPNEKGIEYKEPIEITPNTTIKTIIKDKNKNSSFITEDTFVK